MTAFAVLATGNHYLLDVFAGFATLAVAMAVRTATFSAKSVATSRGACHKLVTKSETR